jgi:hypothetical protein
LVSSREPAEHFFGQLHAMAVMHHWPTGTAHAMLTQIAQGIATVRAYDDTFLLGGLLLAATTPLALLLRYKSQQTRQAG